MHRIIRSLAAFVVLALVVGSFTAVASAGNNSGSAGSTGSSAKKVLATLKIEQPRVEVKKKGSGTFETAKDGQKLRQGDTVRTDATGLAEIDYSDEAYTRLDVNTTFKITKLTEEEGARHVAGSLESGQTWNRIEDVSESGSFEQSGAGATAAITGTAFMFTCLSATSCTLAQVITAEHTVVMESDENGDIRWVPQNGLCTSEQGALCGETRILTNDEMAAIAWLQINLVKDLAKGFGNGPFTIPLTAVISVEDGQVTSFAVIQQPATVPTTTTTTSSSNPSNPSNPTPPTPPTIDANPVNVTSLGASDPGVTGGALGQTSSVVTEDEVGDLVTFVLTGTNPDGSAFYYVFTDIPSPEFGTLYANDVAVELGTHYAPDTVFTFDPVQIEPDCNSEPFTVSDCFTNGIPSEGPNTGVSSPYPSTVVDNGNGTVKWTDSFTYKAVDESSGAESAPQTVDVVVYDDICGENSERPACSVLGGGGQIATTEAAPPPAEASTGGPSEQDPPAAPERASEQDEEPTT